MRWFRKPMSASSNRFDPCTLRVLAFVAQLDRASDSESEGHRFNSCRTHENLILSGYGGKIEGSSV